MAIRLKNGLSILDLSFPSHLTTGNRLYPLKAKMFCLQIFSLEMLSLIQRFMMAIKFFQITVFAYFMFNFSLLTILQIYFKFKFLLIQLFAIFQNIKNLIDTALLLVIIRIYFQTIEKLFTSNTRCRQNLLQLLP